MKDLIIRFGINEDADFDCYQDEKTDWPPTCFKDAKEMWQQIYKERGLLPQIGSCIFCDHENCGHVVSIQWLGADEVIFWVK